MKVSVSTSKSWSRPSLGEGEEEGLDEGEEEEEGVEEGEDEEVKMNGEEVRR